MNNTKQEVDMWLPTSKKEVDARGWEELDVILFTGDAYVDHPSFGIAVIGRVLEEQGYRVAIVPQPNWRDDLRDFKKLGKPRLFFGVSAGSMDSMVNHYTASKRLRSDDAYTPGGKAGYRPDYPTIVYSRILKDLFPEVPVVIGGIEASLRRFTHFDYWKGTLQESILLDSRANLLVYGMGEKAIVQIANELNGGKVVHSLRNIPQTVFLSEKKTGDALELHSHKKCLQDKRKYIENFRILEEESNRFEPKAIMQPSGKGYIYANPPFALQTEQELDQIYSLPYTRLPHPRYSNKGTIPAYEMIRHSVTMHRGCFGGCSFCTISAHQGKFISSRSEQSIVNEVEKISQMPDFKGYVSDLGGPSANMYTMQGIDLSICKKCKRPSCIHPSICKNLSINHKNLLKVYRKARSVSGVKKVFIGSGVRYDLFQADQNSGREYFEELVLHHVSGRLKVAPEHTSDKVLKIMRKPSYSSFVNMNKEFKRICKKNNLNQQLIPYFISSHPGCSVADMAELATNTKEDHFRLEQVQDFTPTPLTRSAVMFYTGMDPDTMKSITVATTKEERRLQNLFFFWYKPELRKELVLLLKKSGKSHLVDSLFKTSQNRRRNQV